jgi:aminopeptidase N
MNIALTATAEDQDAVVERLVAHYEHADNLTDRRVVLAILAEVDPLAERIRGQLLSDFYAAWQHEALVVDVWLGLQAASQRPGGLARVLELETHPAFDVSNPNKLRALYGSFAMVNHRNFHADDGSGYHFLAERVIRLNQANPQMASRLLGPLTQWRRYLPQRQRRMRAALDQIAATASLSPDVFEVVTKSLNAP